MAAVTVPTKRLARGRSPEVGFTLLELMAVIVIIAFVMAMMLPALSNSKTKAQGLFCMNNLRQVQLGWSMYAEDHNDWLPGVNNGSLPGAGKWVSGWLDFSSNSDNTNLLYLVDSRYAQLGPYLYKKTGAFHCPADRSTVRIEGKNYARVRSISMNCWMNYVGNNRIGQDEFVVFRKVSQIVDPPLSKAWVFVDEREDSINDGFFQTNLKDRGRAARIVDFPASYHNRSAGMAFGDGHAEIKRWLDARTTPALSPGRLIEYNVWSPDNPDVAWLQQRSSSPRRLDEW
jgi:prepilin-type N-terminal cleavage/methylation domain-containing protein/prepilin-type processing-associated H-X9-DG protein